MSIYIPHLINSIIKPTHKWLKLDSLSATMLSLGTAAQETHCGYWLRQKGLESTEDKGGFGLWSMEITTAQDIWNVVIPETTANPRKKELLSIMLKLRNCTYTEVNNLMGNLFYACAMTRLQYWREKSPLPKHDDIKGLGIYWDMYYNKNPDKGTVAEFVENFNKFIKPFLK